MNERKRENKTRILEIGSRRLFLDIRCFNSEKLIRKCVKLVFTMLTTTEESTRAIKENIMLGIMRYKSHLRKSISHGDKFVNNSLFLRSIFFESNLFRR